MTRDPIIVIKSTNKTTVASSAIGGQLNFKNIKIIAASPIRQDSKPRTFFIKRLQLKMTLDSHPNDKTMNNKNQEIRTRIAPSPTGFLHVGTVRSALFNYLYAKKNQGNFILRIEDTDTERSKKEYEEDIIDGLKWLGINWDEKIYKQSQRKTIYEKYIKDLIDSGKAFYCYHSKDELEKEKQEQMKRGEAPRHICEHKDRQDYVKSSGYKGIIRLRGSDKRINFNDLVRGKIEFSGFTLGDFSIAKDEATPLYNLAVVIDDYEMEISHIIRGEDHISNTPRQILIYEALGIEPPYFAHLPLILGPDRSKLSKRHGAVSVSVYREEGYLKEALINFMALLGWNPGDEREFFSIEDLIKEFSLERVHKGGAIFNVEKLNHINSYYIRQKNSDLLAKKCLPYLKKEGLIKEDTDFEFVKNVVGLEKERIKKLSEIGELTEFFFKEDLDYTRELLIWKKMSFKEVRNNLKLVEKALRIVEDFSQENLERIIMPLAEKQGRGELLWPLRAALSGMKSSPGPFEIMSVLGKKKTLKRIQKAIKKL